MRPHGWIYCGSSTGPLAGIAGDPEVAIGHFERGLASERLEEAHAIAAELGIRRVET